ncbi:hypothetical protein WDU94_013882, partial [Cyamophila willieti]
NKFNNRLKRILKRHLNAKNLTKAINTYAIPVLTYSFGIIKWSKTELETLERLIRTEMTKHKNHHPKSAIERMSLPRTAGGRGIISITDLHQNQISTLQKYFNRKATSSTLHQIVTTSDESYTPCNLKNNNQTLRTTTQSNRINKWKEDLSNDTCRLCTGQKETIDHILSGCTQLAPTAYKHRHDNMGKIIHLELAKKYKLINSPYPRDHEYDPKTVASDLNNTYSLYWDRSILSDTTTIHNRPDTILRDNIKRKVIIIDYGVVNTNNIQKTYVEKINKYQQLVFEIKRLWDIEDVKIVPIIISTTGLIPKTIPKSLDILELPHHIIHRLQHSVILSSCHITRKFLNI